MESPSVEASAIRSWRSTVLAELGLAGWTQAWVAAEPAGVASAVAPLGVALAAAFLEPIRPLALMLAVAGTSVAASRRSAAVWPWAAIVPLIAILGWGILPAPRPLPGLASCASLLSPPMVWRVAELAVVLTLVGLLVRWLGPAPPHVPRERLRGPLLALTGMAGIVIVPAALLIGENASRPFFGDVRIATGLVGAIVPALIFAFANATLEETVYRGVLLGWLEPAIGTSGAIAAQALAFGLAHNGTDYITSPLPVILAMAASGVIAGLIVKRTGSLLIPIVLHAAFDVPLYYGLACRLS